MVGDAGPAGRCPGYLINYALGAFMAADLRARIAATSGAGGWIDPAIYGLLSDQLFRFGLERPSRAVLEAFLGRPLHAQALLDDLSRMSR